MKGIVKLLIKLLNPKFLAAFFIKFFRIMFYIFTTLFVGIYVTLKITFPTASEEAGIFKANRTTTTYSTYHNPGIDGNLNTSDDIITFVYIKSVTDEEGFLKSLDMDEIYPISKALEVNPLLEDKTDNDLYDVCINDGNRYPTHIRLDSTYYQFNNNGSYDGDASQCIYEQVDSDNIKRGTTDEYKLHVDDSIIRLSNTIISKIAYFTSGQFYTNESEDFSGTGKTADDLPNFYHTRKQIGVYHSDIEAINTDRDTTTRDIIEASSSFKADMNFLENLVVKNQNLSKAITAMMPLSDATGDVSSMMAMFGPLLGLEDTDLLDGLVIEYSDIQKKYVMYQDDPDPDAPALVPDPLTNDSNEHPDEAIPTDAQFGIYHGLYNVLQELIVSGYNSPFIENDTITTLLLSEE